MSESRLPERWSELSSLIDALLDAPVDRRAALIEELSCGDPDRRSELERIVADSESDLPLLDRPAAERFGSLLDDAAAWFPESLADRYRLTREVGRGGMATVYLAHDLKHARDVAVKVVHPVLASSSGGDRFLREIEIVARLHHPHIVPLYDSGEANGSLYYVMPYEDGSSLRHRLARQGPLPIDEAVLILRDVCDALSYAHHHGIVHRDIKPDNVLLSGRHAMVTDFGVAKALSPDIAQRRELAEVVRDFPVRGATTVGGVLGTPAYMAPEQITGDPDIDHRADLYAVGVVAYELLAGRPPFVGETLQVVLSAHLTEAPASLTTLRPDVPPALAELVMTCLAKRPVDRWQSAEELVHRLERLSVSKGDATGLASPRQWWAPTRARVIGAGVVLMGTLAIALSMRAGRADASGRNRWANARVERLTDFAGSEVDAAISRDGRFVAFLADRDSVFDAFVTEVGSGRFRNITGGTLPQLLNEDVRNVGFSGDAADVWVRVADITAPASVSLTPTPGGPLRPFLPTAVMAVWSPDGANVAYHETTPGDPIYIADRDGGRARRVFVARPGVHNHHLSWSPNGSYLYFS